MVGGISLPIINNCSKGGRSMNRNQDKIKAALERIEDGLKQKP
jgi:hypothetical protein